MLLLVRRKSNKDLYRVIRYKKTEKGHFVQCKGWPGEHEIEKDCIFVRLRQKEERLVDFILDHRHQSVISIAKECKVDYYVIHRLITALGITVKDGRSEPEKKSNGFFAPAFVF